MKRKKFKFTESQKRNIWLLSVSGMKIEKTAALMGVPVGYARKEALRQLREVLRKEKIRLILKTFSPQKAEAR